MSKLCRFLFPLALLALVVPVWSQTSTSTGAIQGVVTDQSGAVIVGARVTASNEETGATRTVETQSDGAYVIPLLVPGTYRVVVEQSGFRRAVLTGVRVEVTRVTTANTRLALGDVTDEILVTESVRGVDTATATIGDVIGEKQLDQLMLPTRNFLFLTALQPGVAAPLGSPAASGRGVPQLFVAGQRGTSNNFVLNGVDANNFGNNNFGNVPVPNPDAVREFRVSTSLYDASQGRGSGGDISVVQRSGTDVDTSSSLLGLPVHGSAFWFWRDDDLNANDFFFNRNGVQKPILVQNQFGYRLGGPVPKLRDTHWFTSYQGTRQKNGVAGGVSGFLPVLPASRDAASLAAAFGIPVEQIDPVAVAILNQPGQFGGRLYPSGTGAAVGQIGTFSFSSPQIFNEDQFSATVDTAVLHNNRLAVSFFWADVENRNPLGGGVGLGQGQDTPLENWHASARDTHIFGPNLVNEFRAGFTLIRQSVVPVERVSLADIGMTRFNQSSFSGIPGMFFGGGLLSCCGINTNNDQGSANLSYTIADTVSYTRGKHNLRGGIEFRRYHFNIFNNFASRGALVFANFNQFLTGTPFQTFVGTGITDRAFRAYDVSWFVQDDFRLHPRLTLNLGIRYDFLTPSIDENDRIGNFDPNLLSAACLQTGGDCLRAGFISPAGLPGFGTPGVSGSTLFSRDKNNWAPRVSLAWDVFGNGRLAIRSGYGIYYIRTSGQTLLQGITSAPFFQLSNLVGNPVGSQALADPFPTLPLPGDFPILPRFPAFTGNFTSAGAPIFDAPLLTLNPVERTLRTPYTQQWNLTVQNEFFRNWPIEVGYIGSRGINLLAIRQVNQARLVNAANPGLGGVTVNSSANVNARVLVPGFSANGLNMTTGSGDSYYNAFFVSVRHPFRNGLDMRFSYTFSKSIDTNSGAATQDLGGTTGNQLVPALNRGLSIFDQSHRVVVNYLYELPGPKHGLLGKTLGGWSVSGITTLQSGFPFDVVTNSIGNLAGAATGATRANVTCPGGFTAQGDVGNHINNFLNTSCFLAPPVLPEGTTIGPLSPLQGPGNQTFQIGPGGGSLFGNSGRGAFRAPFQYRWDFAITKTVGVPQLGEQGNVQFRAEFFKLFNNTIFSAPAANVNVPGSFGRISSTTDTTGRVIQLALRANF